MKNRNRSEQKPPVYRHNKINGPLFDFFPIIHRIIIVAIIVYAYYWIVSNYIFLDWLQYIDYGVKIIIIYEILAGSMRTMLAPVLGLLCGLAMLVAADGYGYSNLFISSTNGWGLIIVSILGSLITISRI